MPGLTNGVDTAKKRKRKDVSSESSKRKRVASKGPSEESDLQDEILSLEEKILESRNNYNSIHTLLDYLRSSKYGSEKGILAAVALCRVFCRLMAGGSLNRHREKASNENTIAQWLGERLRDYENELLKMLKEPDVGRQSTALTLVMRLVKEEAAHMNNLQESIWRDGIFGKLVHRLVEDEVVDETRAEFVEKYVEEYDDVRYYTFALLGDLLSSAVSHEFVQNSLSIMAAVETLPEEQEDFEEFYVGPPSKAKHDLYSLTSHRKQAQKAWVAMLRQDLTKVQRKSVLDLMSHRIAPWFLKVELFMDFLTDSFNVGGSTSLLALSGLFYLIQNKNLDYPLFYYKLYSLLDPSILHSKHRSRFFRLLDTFLASTHLPAALVASFIKRLARLTLYAPPSGIIVVIPWIYNLLKNHPACTFMIHRKGGVEKEENGWGDSFRMEESDPMKTDAIESSLWEIHTLQTHYHPNVAAIAKIISEQFTKQAYNLEDFLDHSYGTMLDAELSKDIRKAPEVEYEIPKRIFLKHDADTGKEDSLLVKLWDFSS